MRTWFLCSCLFAAGAVAQPLVPQIAFDSVPDTIKMSKDLYLGEASGVAVNSKGHVFVFSRGSSSGSPGSTRSRVLPRTRCTWPNC